MPGLPSTMPKTPLLLASLLNRGCALQPDNLLVERTSAGYSTISLLESSKRANALAHALSRAGIKRGDRVATFSYNTNRHMACYHAVPLMGAVLHPLNIRLGPHELAFILEHAGDKVAVVDAVLLPSFSKVSGDALGKLSVIVICGADDRAGGWQGSEAAETLTQKVGAEKVVDWDDFISHYLSSGASFPWPEDLDEHSACAMCYTSGTTGNPKGVLYSHRSTFVHTISMPAKDHHNLGGADVLLPVVPYFHANGWGLPYLALMLGCRVLHTSRFTDPATTLKMAVDWGATYSAAVPAIWQTARQELQRNREKYRGKFKIENIICGGSAPPPEMMKWYLDNWGVKFCQGWGMTETSPMGTTGKAVSKFEHLSWSDDEQFGNVAVAGIPAAGLEMR